MCASTGAGECGEGSQRAGRKHGDIAVLRGKGQGRAGARRARRCLSPPLALRSCADGPPCSRQVDWDAPKRDRGEYRVVLERLALLEAQGRPGKMSKQFLDEAVDSCGTVVHLREDIALWARRAEREGRGGGDGVDRCVRQALYALHRYVTLLLFTVYVVEEAPGRFERARFSDWLRESPELEVQWTELSLA